MRRWPGCLMDQMLSGSHLYPPRLLDPEEWLTPQERAMAATIEHMLEGTGNAQNLAMDMLAPRLCVATVLLRARASRSSVDGAP